MPEAARLYEAGPYVEDGYGFTPVVVPEVGEGPGPLAAEDCSGPLAVVAAELAEDELIRKRAERLGQKAARLAIVMPHEVDGSQERSRYGSLLEAIQAAARGEAEALRFVYANVRSDVVERSIKAGHITEVDVEADEDGRILQHGQYLDDVHVNTLAYGSGNPEMHGRSMAETRNGKRAEYHHRQGRLDDHYLLEISLVADLPPGELKAAGFFTDTMSMVFRLWSAEGGKLKMVSAFVAGTPEPGGQRHDYEMASAVGDAVGVDYRGMTATGILDHAVLIPKSVLPGGVTDVVKIADDKMGTFFGQNKPRQDYHEYLEQCRQREAELEPTVQRIVADLVAAAPDLCTPSEATAKLHDLSEKHLVQRSLTDLRIDPRVFGPIAAGHIHIGRYWQAHGEFERAQASMARAEKTAESSSCPDGWLNGGGGTGDGSESGGTGGKSEKSGVQKMTCPFCKDPNQYGDPCSPNQYCTNCSARVVNGEVKSTGDGGRKARAARLRQQAAARARARHKAGKRQPKLKLAAAERP